MKANHVFNLTFSQWMKEHKNLSNVKNCCLEHYIKELSKKEGFSYSVKFFSTDDNDNIEVCNDIFDGSFEVFELKENKLYNGKSLSIIYDYSILTHNCRVFDIVDKIRTLIKNKYNIIYLTEDENYILYVKNIFYRKNYKQDDEFKLICKTLNDLSIEVIDNFDINNSSSKCCRL